MTAPMPPIHQQLAPLPAARVVDSRRALTWRVGVAVVAVVVVVAAFVVRSTGGTATGVRTATVTTRNVSKTLDEVGTIEPVSAASVAFPVAGSVASVAVAKGATVTRGQILATLDTTALQRLVDTAKATLAEAKLTLSTAETASSSTTSAASTPTTPSVSHQATSAIEDAEQSVVNAQQNVDTQLQAAQAALDSSTQICAAATTPAGDGSAPSSDDVQACQTALTGVLTAQQAVATAQDALKDASNALDELVAQAAASAQAASSSGSSTPRGSLASSSSSGSNSGSSAADLAADQKAVDAAQAALAVAQQNVAAATIVSPLDGTVAAVDMAVGDAVTVSSTSSVIRVVGTQGFEVTAIVAVDKLADIKLGQTASVVPDASTRAITGQVVAIGAPITSNGSTTYPVSIGVDAADALRDGTIASTAITTASGNRGLAVPTSAVHMNGNRATVIVKDGSKLANQTVTVGVIGKTWTQIKSGLTAGQQVVIADLSEPLPGSATDSSNANNGNGARTVVFPGGAGGNAPVIFNSNRAGN